MLEYNDGILTVDDDEQILPDARPFSPLQHTGHSETVQQPVFTSPHQGDEEETPSTGISAPHRRVRAPKLLDFDDRPGLTNDELRQWNEGYLSNMKEASGAKYAYKLAHQAKKNAEHWVLGQGIGGVGSGLGQDHATGPLNMFSGAVLLAALTGRQLSPAGVKHARSSSAQGDAEEAERRVRAREEEEGQQVGPGAADEDLTLAVQDNGVLEGLDDMVRCTSIFRSQVLDRSCRMSK